MNAIAQKLETIVGTPGVVAWDNIEATRRKRIQQAIAIENYPCLVYPETQAELAAVVTCAYQNQWKILPCGSTTKLDWGGLAQGIQIVISTERIHQLIEHAVGDLTITAEAGIKFADLQATLATAGQFLAFDPTTPESATLGGIVATADTGSLRQRYGGVRDQLLGISFVRADGKIAKAGGRVVKNVAGYDLMKLFTGSYGTLGIITSVTFRVYPIPEASRTVVLTGNADAIAQAVTSLRTSALTPVASDLLSKQLVANLDIGQGLGLVVRFQSLTASVQQQATSLLELGQQLNLQGTVYADDETELWQKLQQQMRSPTTPTAITCKIGVLPTKVVATLTQFDPYMGLIHTGSGLGLLQFDAEVDKQSIFQMRDFCQSQGGFFTVLAAPQALKETIDVWGYKGNALAMMQRIKQQFDPNNILSPRRFVGGI
ncbi:FAD-binding oxidoreductase [Gloeocapsopsis dulcis]|uniref:FAD-binding oxidoreductase n=1 Tax=Gloeocapsopsis dulcis AAB1 = 1H9 TaxID=1433147 RepID=A0A6N8FUM1_9CHRO|nr:FAD-binding oxidoreductase [Gloeocapsopsis dulcis]MUL36292.1 FAD-binding oxidoreductase [Gloeocapsopsis dulcis AAB1 = 1H9]WNN91857.1 FAD-binding oxidoreductase [Gloeocapsopsis dulcis]